MPAHRVYFEGSLAAGRVDIGGEEAHHAVRVKRVTEGQVIEVLDGKGHVGSGKVAGIEKDRGLWRLVVVLEAVETVKPVLPRLEVCTASPKGGRLSELIDGLGQVGAAAWSLLETERGSAEPTEAKLDRLHRIAVETSKQCGRAWHMEIGRAVPIDHAVQGDAGMRVVLADVSGSAYSPSGAGTIRLLVGPEGGWTPGELGAARRAGVQVARFGAHVMRIETAAVAAAAIVLDREGASGDAETGARG